MKNIKIFLLEFWISLIIILSIFFIIINISSFRYKNNDEIKIIKNSYILNPFYAEESSSFNLQPQTLENQTENFSYSFGRKLLKERENRYIEDFPIGAKASWKLSDFEPGKYKISIQYKCQKKSTVKISSGIVHYIHELKPSKKWKNFKFQNDILSHAISLEVFTKQFDLKNVKIEKIKGDIK